MEKVKKENKDKILEMINPKNYEISWNEKGTPYKFKSKIKKKRGSVSRAQGGRFELKVRKDLEEKGKIIDKWTNNVDLKKDKLIISRKYNPFKKIFVLGAGFPDFVAITYLQDRLYNVIGVEVKMNGVLSKEEKEKCKWYLQNKIFSEIWIAMKGEKRGEIKYIDFEEKYGKA